MFLNRSNATVMIPELIRYNDAMFDIQNMYVAMEENEIIGIILWKKGPLEWSKEKFIQVAEKNSVLLSLM